MFKHCSCFAITRFWGSEFGKALFFSRNARDVEWRPTPDSTHVLIEPHRRPPSAWYGKFRAGRHLVNPHSSTRCFTGYEHFVLLEHRIIEHRQVGLVLGKQPELNFLRNRQLLFGPPLSFEVSRVCLSSGFNLAGRLMESRKHKGIPIRILEPAEHSAESGPLDRECKSDTPF